ncbi:ABC transporter permease [Mycobacterium seoulense]|uniref:Transport permease protein n=1 Tax=Mycobacterium seoulense TaxID=386911 RepID=A0A7I7NVF7_9MYCO|nr:ABC transporter permease [Mycobacterium seoulense]MCV7440513.1 ABC transporter permease [Mycobacterium seoulense]BBY00459.1 putative doxorubicin resistance ABC transporter permease protein DrrC [Mycobacterium seoulense]
MPRHRLQGSLLTESWVQASRLLTEWRRERAVLVGSLVVPVCLLLVYVVVLDERVHKLTGVQSVYALVPVCSMLSGVFGALSTSLGIGMERDSGLLSRMWVMPVHRASALTGRLTAEAVRALGGTVLITALGVVMGLRFTHGWATVLVYVLIPSITVVGFTTLVMAIAIRTSGVSLMTWLAAGTVALAFLNPGTTPIMLYPEWLRPFVRVQPMSPPIEAMWGLAHGGPLLRPLALTLLWALVLFAVFIPVAVRSYRSAAESSA